MANTLLVIDDEAVQRETLSGFLKKKGYDVLEAENGSSGIELVKSKIIDLILTDFRMPDMNGMQVLKAARSINPELDVIVMTAYGSIESATEAMKFGALDFLTKPVDLEHLELIVTKALERRRLVSENKQLRQQLADKLRFEEIVSASPEMEQVLNTVALVSSSQATVLIRGESGTGKELVARAVHFASPRREKPFVAVNCAALPENLLESELFGHEKGAFTGADRQRKGRFELAHGGSVFLDEIGDLPQPVQVKLLRFLQERVFERVGGNQTFQADVRIIAATNRELETMRRDGTFRDDLYYRLNVVTIPIPPLRQRKQDIMPLVERFLRKYADQNRKPVPGISREAVDLLLKYDYPGNIRELENIIEQAVVLCRDDTITSANLPFTVQGLQSELPSGGDETAGFDERVATFETRLIKDALVRCDGIQTKAADLLGMSERHLRYKLKKYGFK
jgi:two-component system NtrC family response regulator